MKRLRISDSVEYITKEEAKPSLKDNVLVFYTKTIYPDVHGNYPPHGINGSVARLFAIALHSIDAKQDVPDFIQLELKHLKNVIVLPEEMASGDFSHERANDLTMTRITYELPVKKVKIDTKEEIVISSDDSDDDHPADWRRDNVSWCARCEEPQYNCICSDNSEYNDEDDDEDDDENKDEENNK